MNKRSISTNIKCGEAVGGSITRVKKILTDILPRRMIG
jgi:hypothetical protein